MKSFQIRSFFWSVFSPIRTEYGAEKNPYLDTFHARGGFFKKLISRKFGLKGVVTFVQGGGRGGSI